jgi:sulfur relay (sulfurtransferase) DsrF/TusC family protein
MSFAIIQTQAPTSAAAWHGQDMLLALASMDLNPQLILAGDGLNLWHQAHDYQRQNQSLHKRYRMLELFDCPAPWVLASDLVRFGYNSDDFIDTVEVIDEHELQQRLQLMTKILRY